MKPRSALFLISLLGVACLHAVFAEPPVDFEKARQLFERQKNGVQLSADERALIERAKAAHEEQMKQRPSGKESQPTASAEGIDWQKAQDLFRREQGGEKLGTEDQKYLDHAKEVRRRNGGGGSGGTANQRKAPASLVPLCDMTATDRYEGEDGGLYGRGSNEPPEALQKTAASVLSKVQPVDAAGKPSASGKVVLISISMSNATQEFSYFKRIADEDARKSKLLTIVDCAQGGQTMAAWAPAEARPWQEAMRRIEAAGVTPEQVQVAWIKLANAGPSGSKVEHLAKLEADTSAVLQNAKKRFPNLRLAYLGSRIWGGNATTALNPEPYAYEGAFAVRHLIQQQMSGDESLVLSKVPLLLWGPYIWAEGEKGRKLDTLAYGKDDFGGDGVHPSDSGREKVAKQLLEFFATNTLAKGWFSKP